MRTSGLPFPCGLTSLHGYRFASNNAQDDIERQLQASIRSQNERIAKIDKAFRAQAQAGPWRLLAIATSGFALLCAWRLFIDKREFEVGAPLHHQCRQCTKTVVK